MVQRPDGLEQKLNEALVKNRMLELENQTLREKLELVTDIMKSMKKLHEASEAELGRKTIQ